MQPDFFGKLPQLPQPPLAVADSISASAAKEAIDSWIKARPYWPSDLDVNILSKNLTLCYVPCWFIEGVARIDWQGETAEQTSEKVTKYTTCGTCGGTGRRANPMMEDHCRNCSGTGKVSSLETVYGSTMKPVKGALPANFSNAYPNVDANMMGKLKFLDFPIKPEDIGLPNPDLPVIRSMAFDNTTSQYRIGEGALAMLKSAELQAKSVSLEQVHSNKLKATPLLYPIYIGTYTYEDEDKTLTVQVDANLGTAWVEKPQSVKAEQQRYVAAAETRFFLVRGLVVFAVLFACIGVFLSPGIRNEFAYTFRLGDYSRVPAGCTDGTVDKEELVASNTIETHNWLVRINAVSGKACTMPFRFSANDVALSHDRKRIAFTQDIDGRGQVFVANVDGSDVKQITNMQGGARHASWSMDDAELIFTAYVKDKFSELYIISVNGGTPQLIIANSEADNFLVVPDWHPTARQFVYNRNDEKNVSHLNYYDMETKQERFSALGSQPSWSADGTQITAVLNNKVIVLDTNGKIVSQFDRTGRWIAPVWSPDDTRIASFDREKYQLVIFNRSDGKPRHVITDIFIGSMDW